MKILIAVAIGLGASAAYGQNQPLDKTVLHNNLQRSYTLYVPSSYTPEINLPLVVNLHALTRNRTMQMITSGMNGVAEQEGLLVAYPEAVDGDWFGPQDNVGFIDALLDQVSSEYSVDSARTFVAGYSQGGMMSYILSVARPNTFAAAASVAGPRPFDLGRDTDVLYPTDLAPTPDRPFPLLHMHGTGESFFIPYAGGPSEFRPDYVFPPVEQTVTSYAVNNDCDITPSITNLPDVDQDDGSFVELISYGNCRMYTTPSGDSNVAEVLLYRIDGGGHTWPGSASGPPGEVINHDINASQEIWNFFDRHTLPLMGIGAMGEFNGDGQVTGDDFLAWQRGESPNPLSSSDLAEWEVNFASSAGGQLAGANTAPEPATIVLVLIGVVITSTFSLQSAA